MSIKLNTTAVIKFNTSNASGAATSADSLPTGVLSRDGVDTADVVTIALNGAVVGDYTATFDVQAANGWAAGNLLALRINAAVESTNASATVFQTTVESGSISDIIAALGGVLKHTDVVDGLTVDDILTWVNAMAQGKMVKTSDTTYDLYTQADTVLGSFTIVAGGRTHL